MFRLFVKIMTRCASLSLAICEIPSRNIGPPSDYHLYVIDADKRVRVNPRERATNGAQGTAWRPLRVDGPALAPPRDVMRSPL